LKDTNRKLLSDGEQQGEEPKNAGAPVNQRAAPRRARPKRPIVQLSRGARGAETASGVGECKRKKGLLSLSLVPSPLSLSPLSAIRRHWTHLAAPGAPPARRPARRAPTATARPARPPPPSRLFLAKKEKARRRTTSPSRADERERRRAPAARPARPALGRDFKRGLSFHLHHHRHIIQTPAKQRSLSRNALFLATLPGSRSPPLDPPPAKTPFPQRTLVLALASFRNTVDYQTPPVLLPSLN
jgi:hypothetical protein